MNRVRQLSAKRLAGVEVRKQRQNLERRVDGFEEILRQLVEIQKAALAEQEAQRLNTNNKHKEAQRLSAVNVATALAALIVTFNGGVALSSNRNPAYAAPIEDSIDFDVPVEDHNNLLNEDLFLEDRVVALRPRLGADFNAAEVQLSKEPDTVFSSGANDNFTAANDDDFDKDSDDILFG